MKCKKCKKEMTLKLANPITEKNDKIEMTISGLEYFYCSNCDVEEVEQDEFIFLFPYKLFELKKMRFVKRKGIFRRYNVCCDCSEELLSKPQTVTSKITVPIINSPNFCMTIATMGFECHRCHTSQYFKNKTFIDNISKIFDAVLITDDYKFFE